MVNYIADNLKSEQPPQHFLQAVYDFDDKLVLLPSRMTPGAYVVARRKQYGPIGEAKSIIADEFLKPDTKMCLLHGLVPVCLMYKTGFGWDATKLLARLAARDLWRMGGADKVADILEAREDKEKADLKASIRAEQWERSGDAWRTYQHRTGQSTIRTKDFHKLKPRPGAAAEQTAPSGSMGSGGA